MMKMFLRSMILCLALTTPAWATEPATGSDETPQALYLRAGKLERQGRLTQARELYESLIERFPSSEFAVKANDRLLDFLRTSGQPQAGSPLPPSAAPAGTLPPAASSSDPKERARALLALAKKAERIAEVEQNRLYYSFISLYSFHRLNRGELAEREKEWQVTAENRVKSELGMGTDEIRQRLQAACTELGITGPCDEQALK